MVEKDKVGGTCLHRGCIPTKALLHAAEVADNVRKGPRVGSGDTGQHGHRGGELLQGKVV